MRRRQAPFLNLYEILQLAEVPQITTNQREIPCTLEALVHLFCIGTA